MRFCIKILSKPSWLCAWLLLSWSATLTTAAAQSTPESPEIKRIPEALRKRIVPLLSGLTSLTNKDRDAVAAAEVAVQDLVKETLAQKLPVTSADILVDWSETLRVRLFRYDEAIKNLDRAIALYRGQGVEVKMARAILNRSAAKIVSQDYGGAWTDLGEAEKTFRKTGDQEQLAKIQINRASVLYSQLKIDAALDQLKLAEAYFARVGNLRQLAAIQGNRGLILQSQSRLPEAIQCFQDSAATMKKAGDGHARAKTMFNLAGIYSSLGRVEEAVATYRRCAELFAELGSNELHLDSLNGVGVASMKREDFRAAVEAFGLVEKLAVEQGDLVRAGRSAMNLGGALDSARRLKESLAALDRAERHYTVLKDDEGLAGVALNRGNVFQRQFRVAESLDSYSQARTIYAKLGNKKKLIAISNNMATFFNSLGKFEQALDELNSTLKVLEGPVTSELASLYVTMGIAHTGISQFDEALNLYSKAEKVALQSGDMVLLAQALFNRGNTLNELARFQEALVAVARVERIYSQLGLEERLAEAIVVRGNTYRHLGRYNEALEVYKSASAKLHRLRSQVDYGVSLLNSGVTHGLMGEHEKCLEFMEKAEAVFRESDEKLNLANVLATRGRAYQDLGEFDKALQSYEEADKLFAKTGNDDRRTTIILNRGNIHTTKGEYHLADQLYRQAIRDYRKVGSKNGLVIATLSQAALQDMVGDDQSALATYDSCLDILESILLQGDRGLSELGSRGIRNLNVKVPFDCARITFNLKDKEHQELYQQGIELSFRALELVQGRSLLERLGQGRSAIDTSVLSTPQQSAFRALKEQRKRILAERERLERSESPSKEGIEEIRKKLKQIDSQQQQFVEIAEALAPVRTTAAFPRAVYVASVQKELSSSSALIEVALNENVAFAFVIKHDACHLVSLGSPESVLSDLDVICERLRQGAALLDLPALKRLSKQILGPIMEILDASESKTKSLIFSLKGKLARLPIEILLTEEVVAAEDKASLPFLIKKFDVTYVPSATSYVAMRQQAAVRTDADDQDRIDFFGLAMPLDIVAEAEEEGRDRGDVSVPDLDPLLTRGSRTRGILYGSKDEVLEIARLFADKKEGELIAGMSEKIEDLELSKSARLTGVEGRRFKVLLRGGATEGNFKNDKKMRAARFVHFAGHGEADLTSPSLSRLVLAQSDRLNEKTRDDGFLYFRELAGLNINAELLTLSACSTNDGVLFPTEGIMGLAQGGLLAGAESVLSTLWRISDDDARELMISFYKGLIKNDKTRSRALAEAKREAIKKGIPVSTWAAYILWDAQTAAD